MTATITDPNGTPIPAYRLGNPERAGKYAGGYSAITARSERVPGQLWGRLAEMDAGSEYRRKLLHGEWTLRRVHRAWNRATMLFSSSPYARRFPAASNDPSLLITLRSSGVIRAGERVR